VFLGENRAALRELEAINKLINFIGRPEWNDLHVYAVMVVSNCLEDVESMEVSVHYKLAGMTSIQGRLFGKKWPKSFVCCVQFPV